MPKTITAGMNTHLDLTVTTLATMWRLTRVDGTEFFFTDHDVNLTFEGNLYKAATGFNRSAISNNSTLGVDNLDIESIFDSVDIKENDLRGGKFDFAEVRIFMINWDNIIDGKISMRRGWLGEVVMTEQGFFRTELRGMTQVLAQSIGDIYQVECRVDLTSAKCGIPILPDERQNNTVCVAADEQGPADFIRVNTNGVVDPILLTTGLNHGLNALAGWIPVVGTATIGTTNPVPHEGAGYVGSTFDPDYEIRQDFPLSTNLSTAKIDTGDYEADVSIRYALSLFDTDDTGRLVIEWLDISFILISTGFDSGLFTAASVATWFELLTEGMAIPPNARHMRVRLIGSEVGAGSDTNFFWDDFSAQFHDVASLDTEGWEVYENRVYECTTPGTTASSQPVYDTTIGNTTTDGTAVFTARDAFMRSAEVDVVTDQENFTITAFSEARAVDDYLNGGAVTWVGVGDNNEGLTMEVRDWVNGTSGIVLFLPMGFLIQSGDKLRIYPGCDKRLGTCRDKFDNVINFRGEPHIPGVDALLGTIN